MAHLAADKLPRDERLPPPQHFAETNFQPWGIALDAIYALEQICEVNTPAQNTANAVAS